MGPGRRTSRHSAQPALLHSRELEACTLRRMYLFNDVSGVVETNMNRPTISPAAQLVAIMHCDDQFDAY
jgi:hypothetical protein